VKQEQEPKGDTPEVYVTPEEAKALIRKGLANFPELSGIEGFEPPETKIETEEAFREVYRNWQEEKGNGKEK
jgi:hypothetical protein